MSTTTTTRPTIGLITVAATPAGTLPGEWSVYLDGEKVARVIEADDRAGWVQRYVTDARGAVIVKGDHIAHETLRGDVRLAYNGNDLRYAAFKDTNPLTNART